MIGRQTASWARASTIANGSSTHIPAFWATAPASQGTAASPSTDAAFMTPIAVGTSRDGRSASWNSRLRAIKPSVAVLWSRAIPRLTANFGCAKDAT